MAGLLTLYTKIYKITWSIVIRWKSVLTSDVFDVWQFWPLTSILTSTADICNFIKCNFIKNRCGLIKVQALFYEFCEAFKNVCFIEHLRVTASGGQWLYIVGYIVVKYYLDITKKQKSKIRLTSAIVTSEYSFDMSKKTETLFLCSCYTVLFLPLSGLECIGRQ